MSELHANEQLQLVVTEREQWHKVLAKPEPQAPRPWEQSVSRRRAWVAAALFCVAVWAAIAAAAYVSFK